MTVTDRGSTPPAPRPLVPNPVPPDRYRWLAAATSRPLPPDRVTDPAGEGGADGWISTRTGGPFDGRTVSWSALTVTDVGVDLLCDWDDAVLIDRVLVDPEVLDQVSRVRVLVPVGRRWRQVGQLDRRDRAKDEPTLELPGPIGLDVGQRASRCLIRFETLTTDLTLAGGISIVGTALPAVGLFPAPTGARLDDAHVDAAAFARAVVHPIRAAADAVPIVRHLVDRADETLGQHWATGDPVDVPIPAGEEVAALVIALAPGAGEVDPQDLGQLVSALDPDPTGEAFGLVVTADAVLVVGARSGLRYGVECLLQQLIMDGGIRCGRLVDRPSHRFRGVHLPLPGPSQLDYFRRLVRHLVVPARFNTVIIEVAGGMEFTRHPEINRTWQEVHARAVAGEVPMPSHFAMAAPGECLSQQQTRALVAELKALDLDVIPEVQSLSHVQYLTLAHPEIAEVAGEVDNTTPVDLFAADQPGARYPSCYCPSSPAAQELIMDVLTEVLDVFEPDRHVHLGHDEVYELGICPVCRTKDPATLFAEDVNRLCAVVAERGLRPIIWADMLQPEAPYRAAAALDALPADLIMMDFIWYFHRERDTEPYLLDHGHEVIIGNLYSSHYPRWEQRSCRPGILGGQVSTWVAADDEAMAREGKYHDIAQVGVMLWSDRYHRHHRPGLAERIAVFLTDLRSRLTASGGPVTTPRSAQGGTDLLRAAARPATVGDADDDPVLAALRARMDGPLCLREPGGRTTPYPVSAPVVLPRSDALDPGPVSLELPLPDGTTEVHLLQALTRPVVRTPWQELREIGRWQAISVDGTAVASLPLTSGGVVGHLFCRYAAPLPTSYYRHQGYTATYRSDPITVGQLDDGRDLCLYRTVWQLPTDGPRAAVIRVEMDPDVGTALVIAAAIGH